MFAVFEHLNLDELKVMADGSNTDILTLSEAWLNPNPGFQTAVCHDQTDMQGGGLLFSVETIFHCLSCLVFICSCIWIKVCFQNTNILVDTYYCPPGQCAGRRDTFLDALSFSISKTIEANISAIIITGKETLMTGALHGFLIIPPVTLASFCVSWWKEMFYW